MLVGLRKPEELIVIVVTLLAYGCPVEAIVHALEVDERTVARWQERAGRHCQKLHEDQVMAGKLDLQHVQADEIRGKGWKMIPWIGLAMMVSTRLWLGGVVSLRRDRHLADALLQMVKSCCQPLVAVLVLTDGLAVSQGGKQLNTAFIERLNATFRERLASLTRRCRHAARKISRLEAGMWLVGCTYNFCWPHHELSRRAARAQHRRGEVLITPAMASGLTEHVWSVRELLTFRIPPPAWVEPKLRGRPRSLVSPSKKPVSARPRPLLRLRKGALCASTS